MSRPSSRAAAASAAMRSPMAGTSNGSPPDALDRGDDVFLRHRMEDVIAFAGASSR